MVTEESLIASVSAEKTTSTRSRLLNLGCGKDYREGWLNVDLSPEVKADECFDAFTFPWDFPSSHFEKVVVRHLVEHIPHQIEGAAGDGFYLFFEELHRVLVLGGEVFVTVPHWKHENAIIDPTHTRIVHPKAFRFFDPDHPSSYQTHARFISSFEMQRKGDRINRFFKSRFGINLPGFKKVEMDVLLKKI